MPYLNGGGGWEQSLECDVLTSKAGDGPFGRKTVAERDGKSDILSSFFMKSPFLLFSVGALALAISGFSGAVAQEAVPSGLPAEETPVAREVRVSSYSNSWRIEDFPYGVTTAEFFAQLKAGNVDKAYDDLLKGSKIADVPKDVALLKSKTREAIKFAGPIEGADFVEIKNVGVGEHLVGLTYLSLGRNFPLRWRLYFYKVGEHWKLIDIRISDRLSEMFKEEATTESEK